MMRTEERMVQDIVMGRPLKVVTEEVQQWRFQEDPSLPAPWRVIKQFARRERKEYGFPGANDWQRDSDVEEGGLTAEYRRDIAKWILGFLENAPRLDETTRYKIALRTMAMFDKAIKHDLHTTKNWDTNSLSTFLDRMREKNGLLANSQDDPSKVEDYLECFLERSHYWVSMQAMNYAAKQILGDVDHWHFRKWLLSEVWGGIPHPELFGWLDLNFLEQLFQSGYQSTESDVLEVIWPAAWRAWMCKHSTARTSWHRRYTQMGSMKRNAQQELVYNFILKRLFKLRTDQICGFRATILTVAVVEHTFAEAWADMIQQDDTCTCFVDHRVYRALGVERDSDVFSAAEKFVETFCREGSPEDTKCEHSG